MPYSPVMIPEISISPAPPMETMAEPYSPFSSIKFPDNGDDFRPRLLTPPPSSPIRTRPSPSPASGGYNSDEERFDYNEGLDKQRFEALLQATRERNTGRAQDLRREVTLKAHNAKQIERRARFITRVLTGPLNTFLAPPVVPLSSPGAVASFKQSNMTANVTPPLNEQLEKEQLSTSAIQSASKGNVLPSLEEISARLTSQGYICIPRSKQCTAPKEERNGINRQVQSQSSRGYTQIHAPQPLPSPRSYDQLVSSTGPADPTRGSRANMLSTLKRRTSPPIQPTQECEVDDKRRKRHSAPSDLFSLTMRHGFQHPVLALPGGF
ncbi:hypothetical protein F5887DRAFT_942814 [Amanita rubescens]|nr:hypothetical protein F5887DRAFT_942814 [Amanita rubescens]